MPESGEQRKCLLLLSGGIDSATAAIMLTSSHRAVQSIFVDYGQPAVVQEREASKRIANHCGIPSHHVKITGLTIPASGEIAGRNSLLISVAASMLPGSDIAIGIHAGTGYRDCSVEQRELWQAEMDHQHSGRARILTPFIDLNKGEVIALALNLGVPISETYSCETGGIPCLDCQSCLDRREIDVRQ